jgi:hypothetical protein
MKTSLCSDVYRIILNPLRAIGFVMFVFLCVIPCRPLYSQAAVGITLFNTGVQDDGTPVPDGSMDTHYKC